MTASADNESSYKQLITLNSDELYRQVWSTPMQHPAAQYGVSGRGLAKICARLDVPCPPRGYWARKAAGQAVVQDRLPDATAETPQQATITPAAPLQKPSPAEIELKNELATARAKHAGLAVPTQLRCPHRVIAGWLAEHARKKEEANREREPWRRDLIRPKAFTAVIGANARPQIWALVPSPK